MTHQKQQVEQNRLGRNVPPAGAYVATVGLDKSIFVALRQFIIAATSFSGLKAREP